SFSMPRCRYPMTTSASTTFSPSRRSTTRSTPCVLGCCGPMLITSSFVSNISPWSVLGCGLLNVGLFPRLTQLQPVDRAFHQQLAGTFERIVLPLRIALPVFRHQNAAAIGMSFEVDAEHVEHFAFEPVRGRPDARHGRHRCVLADLDLHADAMPVARRVEHVDDIEPALGTRRPVG